MEKLINPAISTYMGDYQWPYLPSQNYRQDGECFYYPTVYNPMDYYLNLPTREDLQNTCQTGMSENFGPCRIQPMGNCGSYHQKPHVRSPYNNLHCMCIDCIREMKCADAREDLQQRYPFIYKPEDKQLSYQNEMMAKLKKDRFCSVYQNSYSRDPCQLYRFHNTVPCEERRIEGVMSSQWDRPECFALQKPSNPLAFRNYASAKTTPSFKRMKARRTSKPMEALIRPWHSEYMDGISKVGGNIITEKLHIPKLPTTFKHAPNAPA